MTLSDRKCDGCGNGPLALTAGGVYTQITGWDTKRTAGGTNAVKRRKETGKILCGSCIRKLEQGVSLDQGTLG